jgi:hypothetical protein
VQCDPNATWPPRQPSGTGSGASTGEMVGIERPTPNGEQIGKKLELLQYGILYRSLINIYIYIYIVNKYN